MEIIAVFVGVQADGPVVQNEAGISHPVGIAAYSCAQEGTAGEIALSGFTAKNHIRPFAGPVGDPKLYQRRAKIRNGSGKRATGYGVEFCFFAGGKFAEIVTHKRAPFLFCSKE